MTDRPPSTPRFLLTSQGHYIAADLVATITPNVPAAGYFVMTRLEGSPPVTFHCASLDLVALEDIPDGSSTPAPGVTGRPPLLPFGY